MEFIWQFITSIAVTEMRYLLLIINLIAIAMQVLLLWNFGVIEHILEKHADPKKATGSNESIVDAYLAEWQSLLAPCENSTKWHTAPSKQLAGRTRINKTVAVSTDLKSVGEWCGITVQTYTEDGKLKTIGGDSLRAIIRGNGTQFAIVEDCMDGKYNIAFLPLIASNFTLELILEHSTCDGLRDPPTGWFERGDIHGHFQEQGALDVDGPPASQSTEVLRFEIKESLATSARAKRNRLEKPADICHQVRQGLHASSQCKVIWSSFGYWRSAENKHVWKNCEAAFLKGRNYSTSYNKLWILGDSISYRWWNSASRVRLCNRLFKSCNHTFTYTYEFRKYDYDKINIGEGFNLRRFLQPIESVFHDPQMKNNSVFVINFGLHLIISLTFSEFQHVVDNFLGLIKHFENLKGKKGLPMIIWKTTTFAAAENGMFQGKSHVRFLTDHRIRLFNAYANSKFCSAGIPIFDVYPLTASHPQGPTDGLHYDNNVFKSAEEALEIFLTRHDGYR